MTLSSLTDVSSWTDKAALSVDAMNLRLSQITTNIVQLSSDASVGFTQSGSTISAGVTNAVVLRSIDSGGAVFDVRAFGNDLQSAISAANAFGGGTVLVPSPSYLSTQVSTGFRLLSNVILQGSGWSSVIGHHASAPGIDAPVITVLSGTSRWGIRDLTINGNGSAHTTSNDGIRTIGDVDGRINNLRITNCVRYGIVVQDSVNLAIERCSVSSCSDTAILVTRSTSGSSGCVVQGNFVQSSRGQGIFFNSEVRDSLILHNTVHSVENGIRLASLSSLSMERNRVLGNHVSNCSIDGIRLMGRRIICANNVISGCSGDGIDTGGQAANDEVGFVESIIEGNTISACSNGGIAIRDRGNDFISIRGNEIRDCRGQGIAGSVVNVAAGTVRGWTIQGNTIIHNGFNGIFFTSSQTYTHFNILGNVITNNGWNALAGAAGIASDGTLLYSVVAHNVCYDTQSTKSQAFGIQVSGDSNAYVGNVIRTADHLTSGISLTGRMNELGHNIIGTTGARHSVLTLASIDSLSLATNEMAFTVVASGASMGFRSGNTIYFFVSSTSTVG